MILLLSFFFLPLLLPPLLPSLQIHFDFSINCISFPERRLDQHTALYVCFFTTTREAGVFDCETRKDAYIYINIYQMYECIYSCLDEGARDLQEEKQTSHLTQST